jgi:hypothetical protein
MSRRRLVPILLMSIMMVLFGAATPPAGAAGPAPSNHDSRVTAPVAVALPVHPDPECTACA